MAPAPAQAVMDLPAVSVVADPRLTVLTSIIEIFGPFRGRLTAEVTADAWSFARAMPLGELVDMHDPGFGGYCPDFLIRTAPGAWTFDEQVAQLRETSAETVRIDLGREEQLLSSYHSTDEGLDGSRSPAPRPLSWDRWREDPDRSLARYCSLLTRYRHTVLDPLYPAFETRIRREAHRLETALMQWGPSIALGQHRFLSVNDEHIIYSGNSMRPVPGGWSPRTLTFKPVIASRRTRMTNLPYCALTGTANAMIGVATGSLAMDTLPTRNQGHHLEILIGVARARIVRSLRSMPGTTSDLAHELRYAPSTISYHLHSLAQADAVESHRSGTTVCYHLTGRGLRLSEV